MQLSTDEYEALLSVKQDLQRRVTELEGELRAAKEVPVEKVDPIDRALAAPLLEISKFAVGNLPPQTTRGWPKVALLAAADAIEPRDKSLAVTWRSFAEKIAYFDENRERFIARQRARDARSGIVAYVCEWCKSKLEYSLLGSERRISEHLEACPVRLDSAVGAETENVENQEPETVA